MADRGSIRKAKRYHHQTLCCHRGIVALDFNITFTAHRGGQDHRETARRDVDMHRVSESIGRVIAKGPISTVALAPKPVSK